MKFNMKQKFVDVLFSIKILILLENKVKLQK
jgi:hypothetical protein